MKHSNKSSIGFSTHTGVTREVNEDRYGLWKINLLSKEVSQIKKASVFKRSAECIYVLAVADGMGGTDKGEYAANKVIVLLDRLLNNTTLNHKNLISELRDFFANANEKLLEDKALFKDAVSFGTTLSICLIKANELDLFWIGDSRIYSFTNKLNLEIDEHTVVWDLYKTKQIKRAEIWDHPESYIITKCLGLNAREIEPGYKKLKLKGQQRIMICSDGINSMMPDHVIEFILKQNLESQKTINLLIETANTAGGLDNSTVVLFDEGINYSNKNGMAIKEEALLKIKRAKEKNPSHQLKKMILLGFGAFLTILAIAIFFFSTYEGNCIDRSLSTLKSNMITANQIIKNKSEISNSIEKLVECLKNSELKKSPDINLILKDIERFKEDVLSYYNYNNTEAGLSEFEILNSEIANIEKSIKYIHDKQ